MLSVVIVNYNSGGCLEKCLASIEDKFAGIEYEIVVVDNASTDGSQKAAKNRTATALTENENNSGFAAACNAGAKTAKGKFLLFLNPDTVILSKNIGELLDRFDKNEQAGALGCQNRLPDGSIQTTAYGFPTLFLVASFAFRTKELLRFGPLRAALWPFLRDRYGQFDKHEREKAVDWVTGASLFVKRRAWEKTGEFDERFFLFCEEIDWCRRLKVNGMDVIFDPSFEIEHYVGYSSQQVKPRVLLEKFRSYLVYFSKHHGHADQIWLRMIMKAGIGFWIAVYRIKGDAESYRSYKNVKEELKL